MNVSSLVSLQDIRRAREVIAGRVHRTPLLSSALLGRLTPAGRAEGAGVRLFLKAENLQKTGSFKPRGVLNKLRSLSDEEKRRGLITISAGNHAQALAYGAAAEGLRCIVVMLEGASETKVAASRAYGAEVVIHGTMHQAFEKVEELRAARGLTLVHPFEDPFVIAGQGTVGLEVLEDLPDVDVVVVPIGGGGLISGIAAAIKQTRPSARVIGVEPRGAATLTEALRAGRPVRLASVTTIADGLTAPIAGAHTLAHVRAFVDEIVLVSEDELAEGVRAVLQYAKLLAEPAGAAGVAALLAGRVAPLAADARVAVVLSGGNVDLARLRQVLQPASL
ncbi:MAG TPA: threonine/serine dehydratase [bacterium]|nr:threonine/serine dehydratase [bacterium]